MATLTLNENEISIIFNTLSDRINTLDKEIKVIKANQQELHKPNHMKNLIDDFTKQIETCEKIIDDLFE